MILFMLCFWFFGHKACGILAPRPGIKYTPPPLESEVLTTGLPGKSLWIQKDHLLSVHENGTEQSQHYPVPTQACHRLPEASYTQSPRMRKPQKGQGWHSPHCTVCKPFSLWREDALPGDSTLSGWRTFCRTRERVWWVRPSQALGLAGKRNYSDPHEVMLCSSPAPFGHTSVLKRGAES